MNKRGQIFIIIAIVVCIFVYIAFKTYNSISVQKGLENFDDLRSNYEYELTLVRNECQSEGKDPNICAQDFTDTFLQNYAWKYDPNFGIITIYKDFEGNIIIRNSMKGGEWITVSSDIANQGEVVLSAYDTVEGDIEIEDLGIAGHISVSTTMTNWGEEIYTLDVGKDVDKLSICIPEYDNACFNFDKDCTGLGCSSYDWEQAYIVTSEDCGEYEPPCTRTTSSGTL